jgi:hypothetical protein
MLIINPPCEDVGSWAGKSMLFQGVTDAMNEDDIRCVRIPMKL